LIEEPGGDADALFHEYLVALSNADGERERADLERLVQGRAAARVCVSDDSAVRAAAARMGRRWLSTGEDGQPPG
jgi:hypothetical protein